MTLIIKPSVLGKQEGVVAPGSNALISVIGSIKSVVEST
jgi:hypothetical protein